MNLPPDPPPSSRPVPRPVARPLPSASAVSSASSQPSHAEGFAKFRLGGELGRGGMGLVRAAEDTGLHRELAIKVLLKNPSAPAIAQFIEEAQITGQLEHPNIVPVHELGLDRAGRPWLAMKRVTGRTLSDVIASTHRAHAGAFGADVIGEFLGIFDKICDAMAFAHSRGVIHRDLKPENIMVGDFGEVLVMDWGLAKPLRQPLAGPGDAVHGGASARPVVSDRRVRDAAGTVQGAIFGTPAFMAPEQALGDTDAIAEPADIFALGGVLYAMLTGKAPYAGADTQDILHAAKNRELLSPHKRAPHRRLPRELSAIVMKAMANVPAARYRKVAALQADLAAYAAHRRTTAFRAGLLTRVIKWMRRHPQLAMTGSLSLLFAAIVAVVMMAWATQAREAELRDLAQRGEISRLREFLGVQVVAERDAVVEEFVRRWNSATSAGITDEEFVNGLGAADAAKYVAAFDRLFEAHRVHGVPVTATDYFYYALIVEEVVGDLSKAEYAYSKSLELAPLTAQSIFNRGRLRHSMGNLDGAIADFSTYIQHWPGQSIGYAERGLARDAKGDTEGALADYSKAIELAPEQGESWVNRARHWYRVGDFVRLKSDIAGARRAGMTTRETWLLSGIAEYETGNHAAAIEFLTRGLDSVGADADLLFQRGLAHGAMRNHLAALDDFSRAIEQAPTDAVAWFNRSRQRMFLGDESAALADLDRAIELDSSYLPAYTARGRFWMRKGEFERALGDFNFLVAADPTNAKFLVDRGVLYLNLRKIKPAIDDFTAAMEADPHNFYAHYNRGKAFADAGMFERAIQDFSRAIDIDPQDVLAWFNRANCKRECRDLRGAIADYEAALNRDPRDAKVITNLANVRAELGDTAGAIADYNRAIAIDPQEGTAWFNRGLAKADAGDVDAGLADMLEGYRRNTNDTHRRIWAEAIRELGGTVPGE